MQRQLYTQDISSRRTHHNLQASATLNRRYVRRPVSYLSPSSQSQTAISSAATTTPSMPKKQPAPQSSSDNNSVNITFKHKAVVKPLPKKPVSISISQPGTSSPITSAPKKITISDNTNLASSFKGGSPALLRESPKPQSLVLDKQESTPIFDQQAKIDRAFSLVSKQEQELLNQPTQPIAIFTNSYKKRQALKSQSKTLAEIEQSITRSVKSSKTPRKAQTPLNIPATNMTTNSVESAFSRMQKLDRKTEQVSLVKKNQASKPVKTTKSLAKHNKKGARVFFAFLCSSAVVAALFFIIQSNMPDISIKVAAMQTGIQATYPSYVPRDYRLSGVYTAQDNSVAMDFVGPNQAKFTLTEEKLPWDSTALLNRFVKQKWGEDYDAIKEQGITIYVSGSNAAWVNAGIVYKITNFQGELTKKQIKNIVTSL